MSANKDANFYAQVRPYDQQQSLGSKKTKHSSSSWRSASAPARLSHRNSRRSAVSKVLETNELLTQILSDVPVENLVNLLRVSKTWNSITLKIGYYIRPTRVCAWSLHRTIASNSPMYPDSVSIDINPIVNCGHQAETWNSKPLCWVMRFRVDSKFNSSTLVRFGHQFLTNPPITQVSLSHGCPLTTLTVDDGIRLRDLAEAIHKLRPNFTVDIPREHSYWDSIFTAEIICTRSGSLKSVLQRQNRMRKEFSGWGDTVGSEPRETYTFRRKW